MITILWFSITKLNDIVYQTTMIDVDKSKILLTLNKHIIIECISNY